MTEKPVNVQLVAEYCLLFPQEFFFSCSKIRSAFLSGRITPHVFPLTPLSQSLLVSHDPMHIVTCPCFWHPPCKGGGLAPISLIGTQCPAPLIKAGHPHTWLCRGRWEGPCVTGRALPQSTAQISHLGSLQPMVSSSCTKGHRE